MLIYIFNFISILLYGAFIKNKKTLVTVASIQIFLILALRSTSLGADANVYEAGFEYISSLSFGGLVSKLNFISVADLIHPYSFESGYVVLNWLVAKTFGSFTWLLILHAGFCVLTVGVFIYRYSDNPALSFCLFASLGFFVQFFFILRQTLAMCIMLWSLRFVKKRKFVKFFVLFLIAFTIHRAVIVFLPLYFICNFKITKHKYAVLILCLLLFLAVSPVFANYILPPILRLFNLTYYELNFSYNNLILLMFLILLLIYFFQNFKETEKDKLLLWMFVLSVIVEIIGMYNDVIARAVYGLYMSVIILIPNILSRYKDRQVARVGEILVVVLVFFFMVYSLPSSTIVPYVFNFIA